MILTDYSFNNQASLNLFKFHLLKTFVKSLKLAFLNYGIPLVMMISFFWIDTKLSLKP